MRLAFVGFRHGHIMQLYNAASSHPDVQIVAACEEDTATADQLRSAGHVALTHQSCLDMLDQTDCDAVAVGDYYAKRGPLILAALERGKHIISDKPICTRRDELDAIKKLSTDRKLSVGCMLDLRGSGPFRTARRLIRDGAIGEVHTVNFTGQHPLLYGSRPAWYFEPDCHGGTINDIAVHAVDAIPWITGRKIAAVIAARAWNARLPQVPNFQDAAQFMLRLDNHGGVLGDVSYLAPDGCGYTAPQYWRTVFHGDGGVLECRWGSDCVLLGRTLDKQIHSIPPDPDQPNVALESFLSEISGQPTALSTHEVLSASRVALEIQHAADDDLWDVLL